MCQTSIRRRGKLSLGNCSDVLSSPGSTSQKANKSMIRGNIHTLPTFVSSLPRRTLVTVPGSLVTRRVVVTLPRAFGTPCRVGILIVVAVKTFCEKNIFMFDN